MRKPHLAVFILFICTQLAGCSGWVVRTSTSRQPRVDQAIEGNRGFIYGRPATTPKEPIFIDRKVYKIEVEVPQWPQKEKRTSAPKEKSSISSTEEDKALWGNQGYIKGLEKSGKPIPQLPATTVVGEKAQTEIAPKPKEPNYKK